MTWQRQGLIIDRLAKFFGKFIPETRWGMAQRAIVDFQRKIRRWTSKGDNIRETSAAKWWKRDKIIEIRWTTDPCSSARFTNLRYHTAILRTTPRGAVRSSYPPWHGLLRPELCNFRQKVRLTIHPGRVTGSDHRVVEWIVTGSGRVAWPGSSSVLKSLKKLAKQSIHGAAASLTKIAESK